MIMWDRYLEEVDRKVGLYGPVIQEITGDLADFFLRVEAAIDDRLQVY